MTSTRTAQRTWEDVTVGDELEGFTLDLNATKMVEQVSGSQDFYPVHHDTDFAREAGHAEIFYNTGFTQAALTRLLTDWVGDEGWVRRMNFQMRKMNIPDDQVRVKGIVKDKSEAEDGMGSVDLEIWLENDRAGVTTPATATVLLPHKS